MGYVHLSYYPLGKNIFFIAKDLFENYQRGDASDIHPTEFRSKDNKVALEWTWTKGLGINNNKNAWLYYFNSFGEKIEQPTGFVNYIDSLKWVFSPADRIISKYAGSIKELESDNTLAVHVRRGDTCSTDLSTSFREVFSTDEYCKKISEMINLHNFDSLYIASDSADEIEKISKEFPSWLTHPKLLDHKSSLLNLFSITNLFIKFLLNSQSANPCCSISCNKLMSTP
jgi:hypothetical protein